MIDDLFVSLCILVALTFALGFTIRSAEGRARPGGFLVRYALSVLTGAALLAHAPHLGAGMLLDLRAVPVALTVLHAGPLPALAVAAPLVLYRALTVPGSPWPDALNLALVMLVAAALRPRKDPHLMPLRLLWWRPLAVFALANIPMLVAAAARPGLRLTLLMGFASLTLFNALGLAAAHLVTRTQYRALARTKRFAELAFTDALTGTLNRRQFDLDLDLAPHDGTAYLLLVDLDRFKVLNDTHGHAVGDRALRLVTWEMGAQLEEGDRLYRFGGEEFAALLYRTDPFAAAATAEAVRAAVEARVGPALPGELRVTLSGGLVAVDTPAQDSLARADALLYRAKAQGRNVIFAEELPGAGRGAARADAGVLHPPP